MQWWTLLGAAAVATSAGAALFGWFDYRRAAAESDRAFNRLLKPTGAPQSRFDPQQVRDLPEIARRYFNHAIAPGTPIYSIVDVRMTGTFLLGDKRKFSSYRMSARQVLVPPDQFVWTPRLRSGPLAISGSDALVAGRAWTRFWMLGILPVANDQSSPDLVRSAQFRAAVEGALWLPSSLLPENETEWMQTGPNTARVVLKKFEPQPITLTLTLHKDGGVREIVGQRWSNANPEKRFRLQPFGGSVLAEGTFQGFTIPARIAVGNHYGTDDYLPFFQVDLSSARYF